MNIRSRVAKLENTRAEARGVIVTVVRDNLTKEQAWAEVHGDRKALPGEVKVFVFGEDW